MFYIFNKEKIFTYTVSIFTVAILFISANNMKVKNNVEVVETAAEVEKFYKMYELKKDGNEVVLEIKENMDEKNLSEIIEFLQKSGYEIVKITDYHKIMQEKQQ